MSFSRRTFLATSGVALALGSARRVLAADAVDTAFTPRELGNPNAPIVVEEWFSLTCIHCAHFAENTFPEVKKNLIDTGKIRYVFHDFPTDQTAVAAAMVARTLPPERYVAFCTSLLTNLDRWAYRQDGKQEEELKKMAAFAGMPAETFDKAIANQKLMQFILNAQNDAQDKYHFDSTPTFRFNNKVQVSSALTYDDFLSNMKKAA